MKTQDEDDRDAFEVLERIVRVLERIAQAPQSTFAESMQRLARQPVRPAKVWMTREVWEDIIKGL